MHVVRDRAAFAEALAQARREAKVAFGDERMIIERRSTEDVQKEAIMQGMLSLRADGLRKVGNGLTTLEEIFRVVA